MARKTDDSFNSMTLNQLTAYSESHPSEGLRIADACKKVALHAEKLYVMHHKSKFVNTLFPEDQIKDYK